MMKENVEFVLTVLGLVSSSLAQEKIYSYRSDNGNKFESTILLVFMKNIMAFTFSRAALSIKGGERKPLGGKHAIFSAFLRLFSTISSLYSLNFISYPHLLIARSMKILPVFLSDVLLLKKTQKYWKKCLSVFVTTIGVFLFSSNDIMDGEGKDNTIVGIGFVTFSLFIDGALAMTQTKMLYSEKPDYLEVMNYMSLWQLVLSCIFFSFSFEKKGVIFLMENHIIIYMIILYSSIDSIGQFLIYRILVNYGTYMIAFVTTIRKFVTIVLSIILFHHILSTVKWFGLVMVFVGAIIYIIRDRKSQITDSLDKELELVEMNPLIEESHEEKIISSIGTVITEEHC